jgi:hypothetical protein
LLALGIAAASAVPALALGPADPVNGPAVANRTAAPVSPTATDVVSIYNSGELRPDVVAAAVNVARQSGASIAFGRSASVGMIGIYRGGAPVQLPDPGFAFPMGVTVLPPDAIGRTLGRNVSRHLTDDSVVMSATSASLPGRSAKAGDVLQLVADWGGVVNVRVAAVLPDAQIGGAELLMTANGAGRIGISRLSRAVLWSPSSRAALDNAIAANGLVSTSVRVRRSWDAPDPDDTLGMVATKKALGEFQYRVNANGSVTQQASWQAANLPPGRRPVGLGINARCHLTVEPAIKAALNEVAARGLAGTINVGDANLAGGCHYPRFNRLTPSSSLGFLSRHSWGMALDTNTRGSCQGCIPDFSRTVAGCTTVQIFRKHGFAWGGNFLTPDGMHFEWVGQRRDTLPYPSRFCQNTGAVALTAEEAGIDTLFADDGLVIGHAED